jgi:hypothetical protein
MMEKKDLSDDLAIDERTTLKLCPTKIGCNGFTRFWTGIKIGPL